jgi:transcriptional regulator with XRE-family HTH domain
MKERIREFLKRENKTSAQFAEEIEVQPSSISHILSGRNKPSLDFILKMLEKYSFLSIEWLLFGKGEMYREPGMQDLFSGYNDNNTKEITGSAISETDETLTESSGPAETQQAKESLSHKKSKELGVKKIVWFYDNNSFEEYFPENNN